MKTFSLRIALCLTMGLPLFAHADGCEYDTQCKGDRICENKICVSPHANNEVSKSVAQPTAAATNNTETPKERGAGIYGILNTPPAHPAEASYFCCTASEKLGPYPNPGSDGKTLHAGDACSGTSKSARMLQGKVCE